jgi:hypothetical protein
MKADSQITSFFIPGPAGRLEALLNAGKADTRYSALVCHPHPRFGGNMHNKVVFHAMKALNAFGFPVLRFNFRGAGLSGGKHDEGRGEVDDVRAAVDWLDGEFHRPIIFAGFSFGAAVGLRAACPDPRVAALISMGTPVQYGFDFLLRCTKPKLFVSGAQDQFGPRADLLTLVASAFPPKQLVLIEGADHFFEGHLEELRRALEDWLRRQMQVGRL